MSVPASRPRSPAARNGRTAAPRPVRAARRRFLDHAGSLIAGS